MESYKIYPNVVIKKPIAIDDYVIVGKPFGSDINLSTNIGENAVVRSHTVIYADNQIGNNFQTGHHVLIRESNQIGHDVSIGSSSVVEHHVIIGNNVRIHSQVFIPEFSVLEDNCWLGPSVVLTNAKYPKSTNVKENLKGPKISRGAKIGANVTILPGVVIGENALIGAGSVVTKDIPADAVAVGSPAIVVNQLDNLPYE